MAKAAQAQQAQPPLGTQPLEANGTAAATAPAKEKKKVGKFIALQRIDRLLKSLPDKERRAVLSFVADEHGYTLQPAALTLMSPAVLTQLAPQPECKHPGY